MNNVYYMKLKTGEELLGTYETPVDGDLDNPYIYLEGAITFEEDPESGSSLARYWVAYSDTKNVNINLNDTYFFGKATDNASKFYAKFLESVAAKEAEEAEDEEAYEGFSLDGMTDADLEQMFEHGTKTRH